MSSSLRFLIAALRSEIDALAVLERTADLVAAIAALVHALQRERGLSNGFLASQGRRFADARAAQVRASQACEQAAREAFEQLAADARRVAHGARLYSRIAAVLPGLDGLGALRARIDAHALAPAQAQAALVKLVAGLLAVVFEAADGATDPGLSRCLVALFNLMQGKEFAGQERACGATAFASGRSDAARQQQWLALIASQEGCFHTFAEFAEPALLAQWQRAESPAQLAGLERLRRVGCASAAGGALDAELAQDWFDCCTRRIDAMRDIEAAAAAQLSALSRQQLARARAELARHEALAAQWAPATEAAAACDYFAPAPEPARAPHYGPQLERSIVALVQEQSQRLQAMAEELDAVRAALHERKVVERAKGLLMAHRGLSENEAHKMLRQTAMNQKRRLVEVAESVLAMAEFLPRDAAA